MNSTTITFTTKTNTHIIPEKYTITQKIVANLILFFLIFLTMSAIVFSLIVCILIFFTLCGVN